MFKENLRKHLEKLFPNQELIRWFDPLHMLVDAPAGILRVSFPHPYFRHWFKLTVQKDFERQAREVGAIASFIYEDLHPCGPSGAFASAQEPAGPQLWSAGAAKNTHNDSQRKKDSGFPQVFHAAFMEDWSFESFISNHKNDFALAAAKEVAGIAASGRIVPYNPFVLYGQTGSGKSHLLTAMAKKIQEAGLAVVTGDISYLERFSPAPGLRSLISGDCICLDDVQRISSSPELQDTLIALIDKCRASGKLLALTFDCAPHICPGLKQKLRSRLTNGLAIEVQKPDMDIRRLYIQAKNKRFNLGLEKEQILNLTRQHHDICGINGTLTRLAAFRTMKTDQGQVIDNGSHDFLLPQEDERMPLSAKDIIAIVAGYFAIDVESMTGKNRDRRSVRARSMAMLLCKDLLNLSLNQTGQHFTGRDHSTVLHAINKIKNLRNSDKDVNNMIEELRKLCLSPHVRGSLSSQ